MPRPTMLSLNLKALLTASFIFTTTAMPLVLSSNASAQDRDRQVQSESETFPTTQRMEEGLAFAMAAGEIDQEQADMLMRVHARLAAGIDSGKLSVTKALSMVL